MVKGSKKAPRFCTYEDELGNKCQLKYLARGYCGRHYQRVRYSGDAGRLESERFSNAGKMCRAQNGACGCMAVVSGLCNKHYLRLRRYGDPDTPRKRKPKTGQHYEYGYLCTSRNGKSTRVHRIVMEEKLGRELLPGENVHHKNKVRDDNRPENLELWFTGQPAGARVTDLVQYAKEIIQKYGDKSTADELVSFFCANTQAK